NGDDVVVLELGGRLRLAEEARGRQGVARPPPHHLDCDEALEGRVLRLQDHAHAAAAEHLEDAVAAQPTDLARALRGGQEVHLRVEGRGRGGRWPAAVPGRGGGRQPAEALHHQGDGRAPARVGRAGRTERGDKRGFQAERVHGGETAVAVGEVLGE